MTSGAEPLMRGLPNYDMSSGDVGRVFGVSSETVRKWAREKRLPAPICVNGTLRFASAEIAEFLGKARLGALTQEANADRAALTGRAG